MTQARYCSSDMFDGAMGKRRNMLLQVNGNGLYRSLLEVNLQWRVAIPLSKPIALRLASG